MRGDLSTPLFLLEALLKTSFIALIQTANTKIVHCYFK